MPRWRWRRGIAPHPRVIRVVGPPQTENPVPKNLAPLRADLFSALFFVESRLTGNVDGSP